MVGDALTAAGVADVTVTHYPRMGHWLEPVPEGIASCGEEIHRPYQWYGAAGSPSAVVRACRASPYDSASSSP